MMDLTVLALVASLCGFVLALVVLAVAWDAHTAARRAEEAVRRIDAVLRDAEESPELAEQEVPDEPEAAWVPPVLGLVVEPPPMTPQAQAAKVLERIAAEPEGQAVLTDDVLHALSTEEHLALNAAVLEVAGLNGRRVQAHDDVVHRTLHLRWSTPTP